MFEAKDESRKQAAASEKAKEAAVEEAVSRINRQVEDSMSENYRCCAVYRGVHFYGVIDPGIPVQS